MVVDFADLFRAAPFMGILRGLGADRTLEISRMAWAAGIPAIEVPLQSAADVDALHSLAEGAATCRGWNNRRPKRSLNANSAGGAFTVSPGRDPDVARASLDAGLPHLPGVATATDVQ